MNKPTHTPGPWTLEVNPPELLLQQFRIHAGRNAVAKVRVSTKNSESNARLIAAAPELLDALKACWDLGIDANLVPMVRAAIQKATQP